MTDNKYYTPDISEFRVGFEYMEFSKSNGMPEWTPKVWQMDWGIDSMIFRIARGDFSVKYLDEEDLLDLGFIKIDRNTYKLINPNINNEDCYRPELYLTFYPYEHHNIVIDNNRMYEECMEYFSGRIKNKSELKQILKMIV